MNFTKHLKFRTAKESLFPAFAGAILIGAALVLFIPTKRQYSAGTQFVHEDARPEKDAEALGMAQYFFNIRKDNHTNTMNYPAMLAADIADRQMGMAATRNTHAPTSGANFPNFTWTSLGPTNIGGRTRAILIDNTDATHQTIFAGGVSGGIWKSTNGGSTWDNPNAALSYSLNDTLSNMNVCDIAQGSDGAIYIGTGEGFSLFSEGEMFSSAILGGGIFKSTNDGLTWRLLTKTAPTPNSGSVAWAYTNRIAVQPQNFKTIYAATNFGVYISRDSGATWRSAYNNTNTKLTGSGYNSQDLKISVDGSVIVACIGTTGYYCYPNSADSIFTKIKSTGAGTLNANASRIEFAISPTDPNRIYASVINASGQFGKGGAGFGIFMTETGKTNGGYWYLIGPGGSIVFDPYLSAADQCTYDNTMAVDPANEGRLVLGGVTLWQWNQLSVSDTIGQWVVLPGAGAVHSDQHAIVFDLNNPNVIYFGNDGGIFKSLDGANGNTINPFNRNYNVTQFYAIAYSPEVDANHEGVGGGTQDNSTPYINQYSEILFDHPQDAGNIGGGDGGQAAVSQINPNIGFVTIDYGTFLGRTGNLTAQSFPSNFYTKTDGAPSAAGVGGGGNIDSIASGSGYTGNGCFVFPIALYENPYDLNNLDSMQYTATQNDSLGETIYPISHNGSVAFPYQLTQAVKKGDTINIPDRVVSKLVVAFTPAQGFWITGQAANLTDNTIWIPFGGPLSKPDACTNNNGFPVHCLAWSPDGDALWGGTQDGYLFRFTNMNSIIANRYLSGALWYESIGAGIVNTAGNQVICNQISLPAGITGGANPRDIISMAIDPQNGNNMIITLGNYGEFNYVYYTNNALAATPTWTSAQGNLPAMPVYGSILDIKKGPGNWLTNSAMVATEHGIYTTANITASPVVWVKNNKGMANVLTAGIKQQVLDPWNCNNSGDIYVGTHGRGMWYSGTTFVPTSVQPITSNETPFSGLTVYPNPMVTQGTLEFTLTDKENLAISVYDIQGKEIQNQQLGTQMEGNHLVPLQVNNLKPGTYFISLQGTNYRQVAKFVVLQ